MTKKDFFLRSMSAIAISGMIVLILTWFSTPETPIFPWECIKDETPCRSGVKISYTNLLLIFIPIALIHLTKKQNPSK